MIGIILAFLGKKLGFKAFKSVIERIHQSTIVKLLRSGGVDALKKHENKLTKRMILALYLVGVPTMLIAELFGLKSIGGMGVVVVGVTTIMAFQTLIQWVRVSGLAWQRTRYSVKAVFGSLPARASLRKKLFRATYSFATARDLRKEAGLIK